MSAPLPGSAEWLRYMTASKIAAVVGTSPHESRFSLWHRMAGNIPAEAENPDMRRGTYLEPAILAWFRDQHPEMNHRPGAWVTHPRIAWAGATPDGFADDDKLVEAKTDRDYWTWRADPEAVTAHQRAGVPAGYYDQCQWQMWVTGTTVTHVAALVDMDLVERVVPIDRGRIEHLIDAAERFMASLDRGEAPDIDASTHTYEAIRALHPDIDGEAWEVPDDLAHAFLDATYDAKAAAERRDHAKHLIFDGMGTAQRAVWNGATLLRRQARSGGTPYAVTPKNLPARTEPAA